MVNRYEAKTKIKEARQELEVYTTLSDLSISVKAGEHSLTYNSLMM